MTSELTFSEYHRRLREFIAVSAHAGGDDLAFNSLALDLFKLQFETVLPFRRLCERRGALPTTIADWRQIPAVATSAFKDLELTSLPPAGRATVFHSSGTTEQKPSRHFHSVDSLALYEASLLPWFHRHFLGDWEELQEDEIVGPLDQPGFIILTPSPEAAPRSSLVHMFDAVRREFGSRDSFFGGRLDSEGAWGLNLDQVLFGIRKSMCANRPVALLGTAFSFVHLLDHFAANNMRYRLASGSRVLETGGYKGRSRELPKDELHGLITKHLGIPASHIVCEYGMSELSSQAYDGAVSGRDRQPAAPERIFHFPPWARARIVSVDDGREVAEGQTGLIQIVDLANARSVLAVQTEDLGVRRGEGFQLLGRATLAEPRGCSLMAT